eukprot:758355-Hanusia_phi.AAC.2
MPSQPLRGPSAPLLGSDEHAVDLIALVQAARTRALEAPPLQQLLPPHRLGKRVQGRVVADRDLLSRPDLLQRPDLHVVPGHTWVDRRVGLAGMVEGAGIPGQQAVPSCVAEPEATVREQ